MNTLQILSTGTAGSLNHLLNLDKPPTLNLTIDAWPENILPLLHPEVRNEQFREELKKKNEPDPTSTTTTTSTTVTSTTTSESTTKTSTATTTAETTPSPTPSIVTSESTTPMSSSSTTTTTPVAVEAIDDSSGSISTTKHSTAVTAGSSSTTSPTTPITSETLSTTAAEGVVNTSTLTGSNEEKTVLAVNSSITSKSVTQSNEKPLSTTTPIIKLLNKDEMILEKNSDVSNIDEPPKVDGSAVAGGASEKQNTLEDTIEPPIIAADEVSDLNQNETKSGKSIKSINTLSQKVSRLNTKMEKTDGKSSDLVNNTNDDSDSPSDILQIANETKSDPTTIHAKVIETVRTDSVALVVENIDDVSSAMPLDKAKMVNSTSSNSLTTESSLLLTNMSETAMKPNISDSTIDNMPPVLLVDKNATKISSEPTSQLTDLTSEAASSSKAPPNATTLESTDINDNSTPFPSATSVSPTTSVTPAENNTRKKRNTINCMECESCPTTDVFVSKNLIILLKIM